MKLEFKYAYLLNQSSKKKKAYHSHEYTVTKTILLEFEETLSFNKILLSDYKPKSRDFTHNLPLAF